MSLCVTFHIVSFYVTFHLCVIVCHFSYCVTFYLTCHFSPHFPSLTFTSDAAVSQGRRSRRCRRRRPLFRPRPTSLLAGTRSIIITCLLPSTMRMRRLSRSTRYEGKVVFMVNMVNMMVIMVNMMAFMMVILWLLIWIILFYYCVFLCIIYLLCSFPSFPILFFLLSSFFSSFTFFSFFFPSFLHTPYLPRGQRT